MVWWALSINPRLDHKLLFGQKLTDVATAPAQSLLDLELGEATLADLVSKQRQDAFKLSLDGNHNDRNSTEAGRNLKNSLEIENRIALLSRGSQQSLDCG